MEWSNSQHNRVYTATFDDDGEILVGNVYVYLQQCKENKSDEYVKLRIDYNRLLSIPINTFAKHDGIWTYNLFLVFFCLLYIHHQTKPINLAQPPHRYYYYFFYLRTATTIYNNHTFEQNKNTPDMVLTNLHLCGCVYFKCRIENANANPTNQPPNVNYPSKTCVHVTDCGMTDWPPPTPPSPPVSDRPTSPSNRHGTWPPPNKTQQHINV